ncbi:integrase [Bacillus sp. H1m]|uniref:integrase n=1 Tax=Bacillus sp. H1m TaxID=1397277 RepID=UPI00067E1D54|nr:integrase [Bacillus sp. H1m]
MKGGVKRGKKTGMYFYIVDIDLEKEHLPISQTVSRDVKTFLLGGKTKSSLREILLPVSTVAKVKKHRAVILKNKFTEGM